MNTMAAIFLKGAGAVIDDDIVVDSHISAAAIKTSKSGGILSSNLRLISFPVFILLQQ